MKRLLFASAFVTVLFSSFSKAPAKEEAPQAHVDITVNFDVYPGVVAFQDYKGDWTVFNSNETHSLKTGVYRVLLYINPAASSPCLVSLEGFSGTVSGPEGLLEIQEAPNSYKVVSGVNITQNETFSTTIRCR